MTTKTMLAALEAVQKAMRAEAAAQAAFLNDHSLLNQDLWTAARVSTDVAWATLWELTRECVPDPDLAKDQWVQVISLARSQRDPGPGTRIRWRECPNPAKDSMDTLERAGKSTRAPPDRDPEPIDEQWPSDGFAVLKSLHVELRAMSVELETAIKTGDGQRALEWHDQVDVVSREIHELLDAWACFFRSSVAVGSAE